MDNETVKAQIYGENEYIRADTDAGKVGIKDYERYDGKVKDRKEVYHGIRELYYYAAGT